ncbi:ABC transporter ATP-binding protein [Gordonia hankookensis]|uniref:ABC transporter ATP-binding protein n=1 Tax=Gordonia hankookensis TaxID=589403 RepID=A0ABR7WC39_9ACTN|nr:ABC transporter ATP-binding protein [Gordonia hankookensis]MBD1320366.1 ABC transporter ATP-binding protein [Gordonia hankookensis]
MSDPGRELVRHTIIGQRRFLIPASLFAAIHQGCEASVPLMIGVVIDRAIAPGSGPGLLWTIVVLALLFLVLTASMRLGGRLIRYATQGAAHELRVAIARRVLDTDGFTQAGSRGGVLLSTATSDAGRVGMVNAAVWTSVGAAAALVVAAIILLNASVLLGLVVLVGLIPVVLLTRMISRPLVERSATEQAAVAHAAGVAEDMMSGLRVIKGLGAEAVALRKYVTASSTSRVAGIRAARMIALRGGVIALLTGCFLALVAWLGAHLVADERITVGQFVTAFTMTQFLIGPFTRITMVGTQFARGRASATRIAAVLAEPALVSTTAPTMRAETPIRTTGSAPGIRVDDLRAPALEGLSFDVGPGEHVAVVMENLLGAESLLRCLGRLRDPEGGRIEIDGRSLADLGADEVRSSVLVAEHDAVLFRGTVRENIESVTRGGEMPARAVACTGVATMLPGGLDVEVTERALSLSGGQRQRVVLARALAADSPVLVLHDPTTAVDAVTESEIAAGLSALRAGKTTIVVTTSPALLAIADRVVVVRDGRVAASGHHAGLLSDNRDYRELVAT